MTTKPDNPDNDHENGLCETFSHDLQAITAHFEQERSHMLDTVPDISDADMLTLNEMFDDMATWKIDF